MAAQTRSQRCCTSSTDGRRFGSRINTARKKSTRTCPCGSARSGARRSEGMRSSELVPLVQHARKAPHIRRLSRPSPLPAVVARLLLPGRVGDSQHLRALVVLSPSVPHSAGVLARRKDLALPEVCQHDVEARRAAPLANNTLFAAVARQWQKQHVVALEVVVHDPQLVQTAHGLDHSAADVDQQLRLSSKRVLGLTAPPLLERHGVPGGHQVAVVGVDPVVVQVAHPRLLLQRLHDCDFGVEVQERARVRQALGKVNHLDGDLERLRRQLGLVDRPEGSAVADVGVAVAVAGGVKEFGAQQLHEPMAFGPQRQDAREQQREDVLVGRMIQVRPEQKGEVGAMQLERELLAVVGVQERAIGGQQQLQRQLQHHAVELAVLVQDPPLPPAEVPRVPRQGGRPKLRAPSSLLLEHGVGLALFGARPVHGQLELGVGAVNRLRQARKCARGLRRLAQTFETRRW
eukprot:755430-Hanusia_phi.AAC.2